MSELSTLLEEYKKIESKLIEKARERFDVFLKYVFRFPLSPMHREWIDAVCNQENTRVQIMAPRCSAKSTVMAIAYPLWRIGRNPNEKIKIICATTDKAKEVVEAISSYILQDKLYHKVFPHVVPAKPRNWTKQKITVKRDIISRDATVEALGITCAAAGGRATLLIGDDVVDPSSTVTSGLRKEVKDRFYNVFMNMLEPQGSQVVYICTAWHVDDLSMEIFRNPAWTHLFYAIDENFTPLWPQVWPREKLIEKYKEYGSVVFNRAFRNMPISDDELLFRPEWVERCKDPAYKWRSASENLAYLRDRCGNSLRLYTGVDLAIGHTAVSAYSVIFTIAVDGNGVRYPVEIKRGRMNSPEVARAVLATYETLQPDMILVENNMYQQALIDWLQELSKAPLKPYYTGAQKKDFEIGIGSLAVEFENMQWCLPQVSHATDCDCGYCAWLEELGQYPLGKYSDTIIAGWLARECFRLLHKANIGRFSIWRF